MITSPLVFSIAAYDYYDACYSGALQLEYSQLMCEIILAITAIEVAIGLAFPEPGVGLDLPFAKSPVLVLMPSRATRPARAFIVDDNLKFSFEIRHDFADRSEDWIVGGRVGNDIAEDIDDSAILEEARLPGAYP